MINNEAFICWLATHKSLYLDIPVALLGIDINKNGIPDMVELRQRTEAVKYKPPGYTGGLGDDGVCTAKATIPPHVLS